MNIYRIATRTAILPLLSVPLLLQTAYAKVANDVEPADAISSASSDASSAKLDFTLVLPSRLPDGFEALTTQTMNSTADSSPASGCFFAYYLRNNSLAMTLAETNSRSEWRDMFQSGFAGKSISKVQAGGRKLYFGKQADGHETCVAWTESGVDCLILNNADLPHSTLLQIIASIPKLSRASTADKSSIVDIGAEMLNPRNRYLYPTMNQKPFRGDVITPEPTVFPHR